MYYWMLKKTKNNKYSIVYTTNNYLLRRTKFKLSNIEQVNIT